MILLTIYNDNYLWKNFYYNLFFIPALPHYCCLLFAFFAFFYSSFPFYSLFLHFFAHTTSFQPLFYAFPPRYSFFQSVSRTFLIYLYIFLFDFSSFSYKSLLFLQILYILVYMITYIIKYLIAYINKHICTCIHLPYINKYKHKTLYKYIRPYITIYHYI